MITCLKYPKATAYAWGADALGNSAQVRQPPWASSDNRPGDSIQLHDSYDSMHANVSFKRCDFREIDNSSNRSRLDDALT